MNNMTHRQRFRAVLAGQPVDRTPVVCRLDLWHRAALHDRTLPPQLAGKTLEQIQLDLGMGVSARRGRVFTTRWREPVRYEKTVDGLEVTERFHVPSGVLERVSRYEPRDQAIGMLPRIERFPLQTPRDYDLYIELMDHLVYEPDYDAFREYDRSIGDEGFPFVIIGAIPAHDLMIHWIGYEAAFFQIADDPAVFDAAVAAGERAMRRMWPIVADSPAELFMHGVNFSTMLSPPIFSRYFVPYLSGFNAALHEKGKRGMFHGDGDMSLLINHAVDAGFDVADCLACAPLVPLTLERAFEAWRGKIVIWGGIPSPLLEPMTSNQAFEDHLRMVAQLSRQGGFIAGICDQAMPAAIFQRIARLGRFLA